MPAFEARHAEIPARRRETDPPRVGGFAAADEPGRNSQGGQLARKAVWKRAVDSILDLRIEGKAHALGAGSHAQRHVVAQALRIEIAKRRFVAEVCVRLLG